jgi:hypothetical protein
MAKELDKERTLQAETQYFIGDFLVVLTEENTLKVIVHQNSKSLRIQPKSDNAVIIESYK